MMTKFGNLLLYWFVAKSAYRRTFSRDPAFKQSNLIKTLIDIDCPITYWLTYSARFPFRRDHFFLRIFMITIGIDVTYDCCLLVEQQPTEHRVLTTMTSSNGERQFTVWVALKTFEQPLILRGQVDRRTDSISSFLCLPDFLTQTVRSEDLFTL